jgi:hypothetical protein
LHPILCLPKHKEPSPLSAFFCHGDHSPTDHNYSKILFFLTYNPRATLPALENNGPLLFFPNKTTGYSFDLKDICVIRKRFPCEKVVGQRCCT